MKIYNADKTKWFELLDVSEMPYAGVDGEFLRREDGEGFGSDAGSLYDVINKYFVGTM